MTDHLWVNLYKDKKCDDGGRLHTESLDKTNVWSYNNLTLRRTKIVFQLSLIAAANFKMTLPEKYSCSLWYSKNL